VILGTAGHIDHGKTTLVRALTGVDTDRLPEEKRRGITIELGFAPLVLDGGETMGVVDVPGHEAFVRTMVAGATGIDLALVVVAADEGVMPQTREHLAILELLGVRRGVIALTKADAVDPEWLALVEEDVREATARALPDATILATSAISGRGIPELRKELGRLAATITPRAQDDLFRLPVDRAFTIKGTGTVVTGTVWSGMLTRDEVVRVLPGDRTTRVRGVQSHGAPLGAALPGGRAAVALTGLEVSDVPRGSSLLTDLDWHTTTSARADLTIAPGVEASIRPRTWLRFHVGTSEVGVRIVTRDASANGPFSVRLMFDAPVLLRAGDRFVVRTSAPLNTIAGGIITDPYAPKRARPWSTGLSLSERLDRLAHQASGEGLPLPSLPVRLGATRRRCREIVSEAGDSVVTVGERIVARSTMDALEDAILSMTTQHHADFPLEPGIPVQAVRARSQSDPEIVAKAVQRLTDSRRLTTSSGSLAVIGWEPKPDAAQHQLIDAVLARLTSAGSEPPNESELASELHSEVVAVLRYLERRGDVVQVESDRYYAAEQLKLLLEKLKASMPVGAEFSPSQIRDSLELSRKFLIPFLEYCDRVGYTTRTATGRCWRGS
jgi:selenocysteine-specific elongation factor